MVPVQAARPLDPESLVARIIAEIQANPPAQQMLLRALLTNEFLGVPARLDAIERDLADAVLRVTAVERDLAQLKIDMASLRGDSLEIRMHKWIRPFLSQKLGLRRARIVHGAVTETAADLQDALGDAVDAGRITVQQEARVFATDLVLRAQYGSDRTAVWAAVEASNTIDDRDVERAQESAGVLATLFGERAVAAVMGHAIPDRSRRLAETSGVEVFLLDPNH